MAFTVNKGPNNFCKEDCPFMKLEIENFPLTTPEYGVSSASAQIFCVNEKICAMWAERLNHKILEEISEEIWPSN